jgi:hypothetical protein
MRDFITALLILAAAAVVAFAAPPPGLVSDPEISAWFRSLQNPTNGAFCCDWTDGHVLGSSEWRGAGDRYEIKIEGQWVAVPASALILGTRNPTGAAVGFWPPGRLGPIFCFVLPAMG